MKLLTQIIICVLTIIAHLSLIDLCVIGIKLSISMQDYLAMAIFVIAALIIIALMVCIIYVDIKEN